MVSENEDTKLTRRESWHSARGGAEAERDVQIGGEKRESFGKKSKNTFGFLRPVAKFDFPFFS